MVKIVLWVSFGVTASEPNKNCKDLFVFWVFLLCRRLPSLSIIESSSFIFTHTAFWNSQSTISRFAKQLVFGIFWNSSLTAFVEIAKRASSPPKHSTKALDLLTKCNIGSTLCNEKRSHFVVIFGFSRDIIFAVKLPCENAKAVNDLGHQCRIVVSCLALVAGS